jgi:hypothetical protein
MLLNRATLDGIAGGRITLVFRRWRRPTVRGGGSLRTAIGVLAIRSVDRIAPGDISESDARRAGAASRAALLSELNGREGDLYRIAVRVAGADPRIALRRKHKIDDEAFAALRERVGRLEAKGAWVLRVLKLIAGKPGVSAAALAAGLDREKLAFKADVRKLKELGLTESLETGYRLSPRGRAALRRLDPKGTG